MYFDVCILIFTVSFQKFGSRRRPLQKIKYYLLFDSIPTALWQCIQNLV